MSIRSRIRRLLARSPCSFRKDSARFRPTLMMLEDRLTPSTLATTALLEGPGAGTDGDSVVSGGAWTATANNTWLHTTSTGNGKGLATFTFDANPGATRSGTLTIAGVTLNVTQAGSTYIPANPITLVSGLNQPSGVAVDSSGNVFFADTTNNAIKEWKASTQTVSPLVSGLNAPWGVALDSSNNVYFADSHNGAIKEWQVSTQSASTLFSTAVAFPLGVAVDSSNNVFFSLGNGSLDELQASNHTVSTVATGLSQPEGVAVDGSGNVFIADGSSNAIKEWIASTKAVSAFLSSGLKTPFGVVVDGSGNVFIADSGNSAIKVWSASTQTISPLVSSGLSIPFGVAVDGSGNVFIADTGNNAIKDLPRAFLPGSTINETSMAGTGTLSAVLTASGSLTGIFAPSSDQSWLTINSVINNVISFSFTANTTGAIRTAHLNVLGQSITVTQGAIPSFSNLSAPTIPYGTAATTVSGKLGIAAPFPTGNVTITLNGVQQTAALNPSGSFSASFNTQALPVIAGGYTIGYAYAGDSNYGSANGSSTLTVSAVDLFVTAAPNSKTYGQTASDTGTVSGVLNNDGITAAFTSAGDVTSASVGSGTYTISATISDPNNKLGNYIVHNANATLTVSPAGLFVTSTANSKPYGQTASDTGTVTGVVNGDGITATFSSPGDTAATPVGNYAITATISDPNNKLANYTVHNTGATLTVSATDLYVTATANSKTYGQTASDAGTISGVVNNDGISATFSSPGDVPTTSIGSYPITAILFDPNNKLSNYIVHETDASLTVNPADLYVTATANSKTYGDTASDTGTLSGVLNNDGIAATFSSAGDAATVPVGTGSYRITVMLSDPDNMLGNYIVHETDATLAVSPADLYVTATVNGKTFGQAASDTGTITGVLNKDGITATFSSPGDPTSAPAGIYTITANLADPINKLNNYLVHQTPATLTVHSATSPAAILTVNSMADTANPTDPYLSLREAIAIVNSPMLPSGLSPQITAQISGALHISGVDTIVFDHTAVTGPITLGGSLLELSLPQVTASIIIDGGAAGVTVDAAGNSGIFQVDQSVTAGFAHLTLTHGNALAGGALFNFGAATVTGCTLAANTASQYGGAIASNGTLLVSGSTLTANQATGQIGAGGGIENSGTATVLNSTLANNTASGSIEMFPTFVQSNGGGGIYNYLHANLTVSGCTLTANHATGQLGAGGGISNNGGMTISNSTLTTNTAVGGGGIFNVYGGTVLNCTLTGNSATQGGGGVGSFQGSLSTLGNSLIVGNTGGDVTGSTSDEGGNLIGVPAGLTLGQMLQVDGSGNPLLADNGGPTQTVALVPGSPAIDAGNDALVPGGASTDQRGTGYPRIVGAHVDSGAYESSFSANQTITFAPLGNQAYGAMINLSASASSNLPVSLAVESGPATLSGNVLTVTGLGSVVVVAMQFGNGVFTPANPVTQSFVAGPADLYVTAAANTKPYGQTASDTGTVSGVVNGDGITATFSSSGDTATTLVGSYPITAKLSDPNNKLGYYTVHNTGATLTVSPADLYVTATANSKRYGQAASDTGTISGVVNGDGITATFSSPGDLPTAPTGSYTITATLADPNFKLSNYLVHQTPATLTIHAATSMTALTVNSTADTANATDPYLSLREAIAIVNSPTLPTGLSPQITAQISGTLHSGGVDMIVFDHTAVTGPITLGDSLLELSLPQSTASITIDGGTAGVTIDAAGNSGIFQVDNVVAAGFANLTLTHGSASAGGALFNLGAATVTGCTLAANTASQYGGAIASNGTLLISDSTLTGNQATGQIGAGGGIENSGTATVLNSTLSNNSASGSIEMFPTFVQSNGGGGIYNYLRANLTVSGCTLTANHATGQLGAGGGISNNGGMTISNSTLTANTAVGGGGILNVYGGTVLNCTLTGNSATQGGGGMLVLQGGIANLGNALVVGNTGGDVGGSTSDEGGNLIGVPAGLTLGQVLQVDGSGNPLLADNGGPTQTVALVPGSPAIDAGKDALVPVGASTDQRGSGYPRIVGLRVDSGAYEVQLSYLVTVAGSSTTQAGKGFLVVVQAADAFGNPVTTYSGPATVSVSISPTTSQSAASNFPSTVSLNSSGLGLFLGTIQQAGSYTITASSGTFSGRMANPLAVTAGPAAQLTFTAQPQNTPTGVVLPAVGVQVQDLYGNPVSSDNTDIVTLAVASGPGTFTAGSITTATVHNGVATFSNLTLAFPGSYVLSAVVPGRYTGPNSSAFTIAPLQVVAGSFQGTPWGFSLQFNAPFLVNSVTPVLYGHGFGSSAPPPSVIVTTDPGNLHDTAAYVSGSLVLDQANNQITFISTTTANLSNSELGSGPVSPLLPDGVYAVVLRSSAASDGFQALINGGGYLDGLGTGKPGSGDFVASFTVNAAAAHDDIVWIPPTADGPGQPLNAPGKNQVGGGYPIYLSDRTGSVTKVQLTLNYDPTLLTVTGVSGAGFSLLASSTSGHALLQYSGPALPTGVQTPIGYVLATVPSGTTADPVPYKKQDLLTLTSVTLGGSSISVTTGNAVHLVAYAGDADGSGSYSAGDAVLITRALLNTDTGFAAYPLVDPLIVADTDGAGYIPADAALQANEAGVGFPTANLPIPPIPPGIVFQTSANNVQPTVSMPTNEHVQADRTVMVLVNRDEAHPAASTGMIRGNLALTYDPGLFTLSSSVSHVGLPVLGEQPLVNSLLQPLVHGPNSIEATTLRYALDIVLAGLVNPLTGPVESPDRVNWDDAGRDLDIRWMDGTAFLISRRADRDGASQPTSRGGSGLLGHA